MLEVAVDQQRWSSECHLSIQPHFKKENLKNSIIRLNVFSEHYLTKHSELNGPAVLNQTCGKIGNDHHGVVPCISELGPSDSELVGPKGDPAFELRNWIDD